MTKLDAGILVGGHLGKPGSDSSVQYALIKSVLRGSTQPGHGALALALELDHKILISWSVRRLTGPGSL